MSLLVSCGPAPPQALPGGSVHPQVLPGGLVCPQALPSGGLARPQTLPGGAGGITRPQALPRAPLSGGVHVWRQASPSGVRTQVSLGGGTRPQAQV